MTNGESISQRKTTEMSEDKIIPCISGQILNKIEDFDNIVVMSGTATRKPFEKKENIEVNPFKKNNFKDSILKLRAPFYKSHHKQTHNEEKLMTKSCEILLGCIKPCKEIHTAKSTKATESVRIGNVLKMTNTTYVRKAIRKVHFFSFSENNTSFYTRRPLKLFQTISTETENENLEIKDEDNKDFDEPETSPNDSMKTVSSEDFVTKVFPQKDTPKLI